MRYYELALSGYHLDTLTYESEEEFEPLAEVLVDLATKKAQRAIVLREVTKPNFKTKAILQETGKFLSPMQFELAKFISSYYTCKLGFVLRLFECAKPYETKPLQIPNAPNLSQKQQEAFEFIQNHTSSLLFADTGSGKTEIYISLIKTYLEQGKQVLLLMPEISLTPQMQKRLELYFKGHFELWHSKISKKKKQEILTRLEQGELLLIAGARSALFLPFAKLECIIVDEEHDHSYKASNRPFYNARDLALFLAHKFSFKVLLGSATPSLTSFYKQKSFRLKGTFFESKKTFLYDESDLALSSTILRELKTSLRAKKQAIIFLPNRANFRQILCKDCGKSIECPFCSIALSLHKKKNLLKCHYCGYASAIVKSCQNCGGIMLEARKIGTAELCEQLNEALSEFSPQIAQFDRDAITSLRKLNTLLKDFNEHKIDILVGTSMLAKGHDYHSVDLSVILGLDEFLFRPNYRASEESLALAMQVAGRAGRKGEARVLLQTRQRAFFEKFIENYDEFLQMELENRKDLYPPFKRLLRLVIEDKDKIKAHKLCENLAKELTKVPNLELVGYGACAIELMNAHFRFYLLLRSTSHQALLKASKMASVFENVSIDIDPIDFS